MHLHGMERQEGPIAVEIMNYLKRVDGDLKKVGILESLKFFILAEAQRRSEEK